MFLDENFTIKTWDGIEVRVSHIVSTEVSYVIRIHSDILDDEGKPMWIIGGDVAFDKALVEAGRTQLLNKISTVIEKVRERNALL